MMVIFLNYLIRINKLTYLIVFFCLYVAACDSSKKNKIENNIGKESFDLFDIVDVEFEEKEDTIVLSFFSEYENIYKDRAGLFFETIVKNNYKYFKKDSLVLIRIFYEGGEIFTLYNISEIHMIVRKYEDVLYSKVCDYIFNNISNESFMLFDGFLRGLYRVKNIESYNIDFAQLFQGMIVESQNNEIGLYNEIIKSIVEFLELKQKEGEYIIEYKHITNLCDMCYK